MATARRLAALWTHCQPCDGALMSDQTQPLVRIRPVSGWRALDLASVWEYRELVYYLVWRDIIST